MFSRPGFVRPWSNHLVLSINKIQICDKVQLLKNRPVGIKENAWNLEQRSNVGVYCGNEKMR